MATTARSRFLSLLRANEADADALFAVLRDQMTAALLRAADATGHVPLSRWNDIQQQIGRLVLALFITSAQGFFAPYDLIDGRIVPRSPFTRALLARIEAAALLAVQRHERIMRSRLAARPDLIRHFELATVLPLISLAVAPAGRAAFDSLTLADRIWRMATLSRQRTELLLSELLAEQAPVTAITDALGTYWTPGQTLRRTGRYGLNGTYEALRLSRGEVARTYSGFGLAAAQADPFVIQFSVVLSPSHIGHDECDDQAAGGPYDLRAVEHLPIFHGNCMCGTRWLLTPARDVNLNAINANLLSPLTPERFVAALMADRVTQA